MDVAIGDFKAIISVSHQPTGIMAFISYLFHNYFVHYRHNGIFHSKKRFLGSSFVPNTSAFKHDSFLFQTKSALLAFFHTQSSLSRPCNKLTTDEPHSILGDVIKSIENYLLCCALIKHECYVRVIQCPTNRECS